MLFCGILTGGLTTPPTKIFDFGHLPLHRGGLRFAPQQTDKLKFELLCTGGAVHLRIS